MNELNYASLEASKKLVDNGILVREIKFGDRVHHITGKEGIVVQFDPLPVVYCENGTGFRCDPRTLTILYSFAEVWRELPETTTDSDGTEYTLALDKVKVKSTGKVVTTACYQDESSDWFCRKFFASANPTDTLIDLLIWVKKEAAIRFLEAKEGKEVGDD